jgi:hypothetical protein
MKTKKEYILKKVKNCPLCYQDYSPEKSYRTAYCSTCTKIIAYQKKLRKHSIKELQDFIAHYKELIQEIEHAIEYRNDRPYEIAKAIVKWRKNK